jgi:hypothetical protein
VIDKRNTRNEKNAQTQRDRNTTADRDETRADGDDDDETGYSEDDHEENEDGAASHSKRRQADSFYFTTGEVKRMESKEDGSLTATCQVGGHARCSNIIPMPNGGTQGVAQHFLKYHADLNVRIRALKVLPGAAKNPPDFMTLLNHAAPKTQEQRPTIVDTLRDPDIHTLTLCHGHTLFIVTDTHQHIDRGLYTYMTSYVAQAYRLSILIDKPTLFINNLLIRL